MGPVGAHNSVVGADQGFRAPSGDQESVRDSIHEDSASARIAAGQRPRPSFRLPQDGSAPPPHLLAAISAALFNCESAQATDAKQRFGDEMIEAAQQRSVPMGRNLSAGDTQALSACHGIVCETGAFGGGTCEASPGRPTADDS